MEASDADEQGSLNVVLAFELVDPTLPFAIDSYSGIITVNESLEATTYDIEVRVQDDGTPSLNSTAIFEVEVAPANDYAPEFQEPFEFNITENSVPTTPVFTFRVTDGDSGSEAMANLTLSTSDYSVNFSLNFTYIENYTEGYLYLLDAFDREKVEQFSLSIEAEDLGYEEYRRSSNQTFTVNVLDVNDNAPMFIDAPYMDMVAEDRTDGHVFFQVSASDMDSGTNQELKFQLVDDFGGLFAIDEQSGNISVEGRLHKGTRDQYLLEIVVSDGGTPSLNDTTTMNLTIEEVNDNTPFFIEPDETVTQTLSEDTEPGYILLNISVGDNDTGLAGQVDLSLNPSDSPFQLLGDSLILNTSLNYEVSTCMYIGIRNLMLDLDHK